MVYIDFCRRATMYLKIGPCPSKSWTMKPFPALVHLSADGDELGYVFCHGYTRRVRRKLQKVRIRRAPTKVTVDQDKSRSKSPRDGFIDSLMPSGNPTRLNPVPDSMSSNMSATCGPRHFCPSFNLICEASTFFSPLFLIPLIYD
uniref:UDENN domain-containing protein n=1 Tax=Panagrellus redivivus TaxID=6233 RepID=A0A7E4UVL6_PANRE